MKQHVYRLTTADRSQNESTQFQSNQFTAAFHLLSTDFFWIAEQIPAKTNI